MNNFRKQIVHQFVNAFLFVCFVLLISAPIVYAAISWPATPSGEVDGGKYSAKLVPSGAVMAFNLATCPSGWRAADGTNSTPDLRGEFLRGLDNGRGVDASRTLASTQGDAIRNITGSWGSPSYGSVEAFYGTASGAFVKGARVSDMCTSGAYFGAALSGFDASRVVPTANENRPRNVALLFCVKN